MLLRRQWPLMRRSNMAVRERKQPVLPEVEQVHACGLRHRSTCECWSFMAAILWWLLRTNGNNR